MKGSYPLSYGSSPRDGWGNKIDISLKVFRKSAKYPFYTKKASNVNLAIRW